MTVYHLSKKALTVWRIRIFSVFMLIWVLFAFLFGTSYALFILSFLLLTATLLAVFGYLPLYHKNYSVELHEHAAVIKKGVWIRHEFLMPYGGMIYAERVETPLSKMYGLFGVKLHAAKRGLSVSLLERDKAEEFIAFLRQKEV